MIQKIQLKLHRCELLPRDTGIEAGALQERRVALEAAVAASRSVARSVVVVQMRCSGRIRAVTRNLVAKPNTKTFY